MYGKSKTSLLGIDISSSVVKLLELSKKGERYSVEAYAVEPLPDNSVVESRVENAAEVSAALKRVLKRSGSKAKEVAVAVSGASVITKTVSFPANLSEREMEGQIVLEAEQHIPYPLEEVRLDFEVLGVSANDPDAVDVLLAASRRENVDVRVNIVEQAGLKARLVDVEAYTMENAFALISQQMPNHGQGLTVAVVDIGATMTTVHVFFDGKIVYTREQAFGGRLLTAEIEKYYGMTYQEAGRSKRENSLPDDYIPNVLEPFKRAMTQHITRALQFFFSASPQYQVIDYIVLAGGCSSIPGVDAMIEEDTGTATSIANPFADMIFNPKINSKALSNDAPSMMIACGLAMRNYI